MLIAWQTWNHLCKQQIKNQRWTVNLQFRKLQSRKLPCPVYSKESASSGVSRSSTLMSISSGVSKLSSESTEPSLWSKERLIFGAVSFILLGWEPLRSREFGGSERREIKK